MKKTLILTIAALLTVNLMAVNVTKLTPKSCRNITRKVDIWINGGKPVKTNLKTCYWKDSFSGKLLRVLTKKDDVKAYNATYKFPVKKEGTYQFYAALVHQGLPHGSDVMYRFDDGEWQTITKKEGKRISWGISRAVNWESLGEQKLTAGEHTLELRVNKKAANGNWSFMCDGIVAVINKTK